MGIIFTMLLGVNSFVYQIILKNESGKITALRSSCTRFPLILSEVAKILKKPNQAFLIEIHFINFTASCRDYNLVIYYDWRRFDISS